MNGELVGQVAIAILGAVGPLIGLTSRRKEKKTARDEVQQDLHIMEQLGPDSEARNILAKSIDDRVRRLAEEWQHRRSVAGISLALTFIILSTFTGIWSFRMGGWWLLLLIPAVFIMILGSVGLSVDAKKAKRD